MLSCTRGFYSHSKTSKEFLHRFPFLPDEQCTITKQNQIYTEVLIGTNEERQLEQWQQTIHYVHTLYKSDFFFNSVYFFQMTMLTLFNLYSTCVLPAGRHLKTPGLERPTGRTATASAI